MSTTMAITPIKKYSSLLEQDILKADQSQFNAMINLQKLFNDIKDYNPQDVAQGIFTIKNC